MRSSGVPNLFIERDDQNSAVFATTDPAVIEVLKGVFEESEDLSNFYDA